MLFEAIEIVKDIVGHSLSTGPAGHGIFSEVTSVGPQGAETTVNEQSLERAKAGEQKLVKEIDALAPKTSFSALPDIAAKNDGAAKQYANRFAKNGLGQTVDRTMTRSPASTRRPRMDLRAQLARQQSSKNPLMVIKQRQLLELRRTFDMIAKKQTIALNPAATPQKVPMSAYAVEQKMRADAKMKNNRLKKAQLKAWAGMITEPGFYMM